MPKRLPGIFQKERVLLHQLEMDLRHHGGCEALVTLFLCFLLSHICFPGILSSNAFFLEKVRFTWSELLPCPLLTRQESYKPCYKQSWASMDLPFSRSWQDLVVCLSFPNRFVRKWETDLKGWAAVLLLLFSYLLYCFYGFDISERQLYLTFRYFFPLKNDSYYYLPPQKQK